MDNMLKIKHIKEGKRQQHLQTHLAFADCEKAFCHMDRIKLLKILEKRGYVKHLMQAIQSLYQN
jgi:hypothetical protein